MNARETLQALLDGKTIIGSSGHLWKLDEYDGLVHRKPEKKEWQESPMVFNGDCEVYEEYSLTFEEALREMLDGKIVMCNEPFPYAYRFHNGRFESAHVSDCFTRWEQEGMPSFKQKSKWKVVG